MRTSVGIAIGKKFTVKFQTSNKRPWCKRPERLQNGPWTSNGLIFKKYFQGIGVAVTLGLGLGLGLGLTGNEDPEHLPRNH